jgi:cobalt-zinc-cadmium efflux system outer membrane protein
VDFVFRKNIKYYQNTMRKVVTIITILILELRLATSQDGIPFEHSSITFSEYMELVKTKNIEYAAEKLNINIAEAAVKAAKIFSDPIISVDVSTETDKSIRTGYGFTSEVVKTVDLGGERKARIDLSVSEKDLTSAMLADYFRNLQADATLFYLEAMKHRQLYIVRNNSYQTMKRLAEADSIRFRLGSIMEIDAIQSKLETGVLRNEMIHAVSEWKNALSDISIFTGVFMTDTLFLPSSQFPVVSRDFRLNDLVTEAQNNRADLQAAFQNKNVAQKALVLTRKGRNTDVDLKFGFSNLYLVGDNSSSPGVYAGVALPLKFSNFNKGELKMAEFRVEQSERIYDQAELKIKNEVIQAWEYYKDYCRQVENFNNGLLEDAENVRKGKIYSYQRGETSLLEVLNAQRTYNDVQSAYYETLFNQAAALVQLERATGIWDINF